MYLVRFGLKRFFQVIEPFTIPVGSTSYHVLLRLANQSVTVGLQLGHGLGLSQLFSLKLLHLGLVESVFLPVFLFLDKHCFVALNEALFAKPVAPDCIVFSERVITVGAKQQVIVDGT